MRQRAWAIGLLGLAVLTAAPPLASARIKLITLPPRERVEIQLDNPNATLVEEERIVPLVQGVNQVDFSWANTQIDPNTIVFRVLPRDEGPAKQAGVAAGATRQGSRGQGGGRRGRSAGRQGPFGQLSAQRVGPGLAGLFQRFRHRPRADQLPPGQPQQELQLSGDRGHHDEKTLVLSEYIRIQNLANESFGSTELWAGFGPRFLKPIGLNETKEMLVEKYAEVPVKKTYTCDPQAHGYLDRPQNKLLVPMHYVLKNDKANHLGAAPLQYGKVRIFQEDGHGGTAFIGEDWGKFTPLDDEMRLYVGVGPGRGRQTHHRQERAAAGRRQPVRPRSDRQVRDRELQGQGRHARRLGERPRPSATSCTATTAATCSGNWASTTTFARRPGQGKEHLRATRSSTSRCRPAAPTARPRRSSRNSTWSSRTSGNQGKTHANIC